jgi:ABC-type amino acid transport substrate-binding protein
LFFLPTQQFSFREARFESSAEYFGVAMSPGEEDLREAMNRAIQSGVPGID